MKDYELRAKLEKQLVWDTHKFDTLDSRVENAKTAIKELYKRHKLIEGEEESYIKGLEEDKAILFDIMKASEFKLNNMGKSFCQFCENSFSPQGIKSHETACAENPMNIEKKEAKKLAKEAEKKRKADEAEAERIAEELIKEEARLKRLAEIEEEKRIEEQKRLQEEAERKKQEAEILEEKRTAAEELRKVADAMNGETNEIEWLMATHIDWQEDYARLEGGKAIWQGRITRGFKNWCEIQGYKIGE